MEYVKFCPKCKSANVTFSVGASRTPFDMCRDCGYQLINFPEIRKDYLNDLK